MKDEIKLSTFYGLKRNETNKLIREIISAAKEKDISMKALNATIIRENFSNSCDNFVKSVSESRSLSKKRKSQVKKTNIKGIIFVSFAGVSAALNAALAIPTAGVLPSISYSVSSASIVLALQYFLD